MRRAALAGIHEGDGPQHAGLWLERYLSGPNDEVRLIDETCRIALPAGYKRYFALWKEELLKTGALCAEAQSEGRVVVGLGGESVLETAITLHRTYGTPFIPGSALKGLAASFAHLHLEAIWRKDGPAHRTVFGTQDQAGYVVFHDALYVPSNLLPLCPDVLTVHHPDYYQPPASAAKVPTDWDSPTPVPFIASHGKFLVALSGPPGWASAAWQILQHALEQQGVGAKTSRGYGRMKLGQPEGPKAVALAQPAGLGLADEIRRGTKNQIGGLVERWRKLPDGPPKRAAAEAFLARVEELKWTDAAQKSWYLEVRNSLK